MFWSSGDFAVLHAGDPPWNCNIMQHGQPSHLCVKGKRLLEWNTQWKKSWYKNISKAHCLKFFGSITNSDKFERRETSQHKQHFSWGGKSEKKERKRKHVRKKARSLCTVYTRAPPHRCGRSGWAWIALGWPLPTVFLPTCTAAERLFRRNTTVLPELEK